ncbi:MAG: SPOR domain-containing protein [Candidatus Omnitrophota bacterium]
MANQNKSLRIILILVAAGAVILLLSLKQKTSTSKVEMQEVFNQKPSNPSAESPVVVKDPVTSPAIVTSPEYGQEAGFAVQVYSFQDQKRANTALANLKNMGYKAYIEMSDLGEKGTWYRVRIGNLENEAQAKSLLETIRKSFNSGFIVKPKK